MTADESRPMECLNPAALAAAESVDVFGDPTPFVVARAPGWARLRARWLEDHPCCAVCGTCVDCVPHHVVPVHVDPARELDPDNLITLCPPHHLLVGHLMSWRSWGPLVRAYANLWREMIAARPMAAAGESP